MEKKQFEEIYYKHRGHVRSALFYFCGANDLDDLVQEVFIKVWKGFDSFKGDSSLGTWIYRIAYNTAMDYLRKNNFRNLPLEENDGTQNSDIKSIVQKDLVQKSLQQLEQKKREVIIYHYLLGMKLEEIADIIAIPLGTVKSRVSIAKSELSKILTKQGAL